ncbi:MAG: DUF3800 domain-containing protein [Methylophilus sp.]
MTLQAYIDDSYDDDSGVYVLAGFIASENDWRNFTTEWERMLPKWGVINPKTNQYTFKYTLMNNNERAEKIPVFLSTVEKYVLGYITAKINIHDLKKAQNRIVVPDVTLDWKEIDSFFFTFRMLIDRFHLERSKMFEVFSNKRIDFYFDEQSQKKRVETMWGNYLANRPPETKSYYGQMPKFVNDEKCLPVQAADLLAGWAREMYLSETPEKINKLDLEGFNSVRKNKLMRIEISATQEQIVKDLIKVVRNQVGFGKLIFDLGPKVTF